MGVRTVGRLALGDRDRRLNLDPTEAGDDYALGAHCRELAEQSRVESRLMRY
jgi:hypothetical protein